MIHYKWSFKMTNKQLKVNIKLGRKTVRELTSNTVYKFEYTPVSWFSNNFNNSLHKTKVT